MKKLSEKFIRENYTVGVRDKKSNDHFFREKLGVKPIWKKLNVELNGKSVFKIIGQRVKK